MRFTLTKRNATEAIRRTKEIWPSTDRPPAFLISRRLLVEPGGDPIDWESSKRATLQTNRELLGLDKPELSKVWENVVGICGPRFNKLSGTIKLTSELYPHSEQNAKHVHEMMLQVLDEARVLAGLPKGVYNQPNPHEVQAVQLEASQVMDKIIRGVDETSKLFAQAAAEAAAKEAAIAKETATITKETTIAKDASATTETAAKTESIVDATA
eukprot:TRINITY_DN14362_c0_g1_i1.p1 TRINITY_DN14362_c0_g1~~TRINITY_DN14362_c0_g1_i1.p1  ORF type:complete len:213 (-),score=47.59 TRINITY_DN14362_c0_g1_i1:159-797(-)